MFFDSRVFHTAKDPNFLHEYEDAFCVDGELGRAAVSDGASTAIFCPQWAQILTRETVAHPPELGNAEAVAEWLAACRQSWSAAVAEWFAHADPMQSWSAKMKLRQIGGAFATLLWVELHPDDKEAGEPGGFRLLCHALGDCNLFHLRGDAVLTSFPMNSSAEFDRDPVLVSSIPGRDDLPFLRHEAECRPGDLLVLCSDAVGKWAMTRTEAGDPPDWAAYWDVSPGSWLEEILGLRATNAMRVDDATLVLLRVGTPEPTETQEFDTAFADDPVTEAESVSELEVSAEDWFAEDEGDRL